MFIQAVNARGDGVGETQFLRNEGAALATDFHQFPGIPLLRSRHLQQFPDPLRQRRIRGHVLDRELQAVKSHFRPVRGLDIALGANLIGIQDMK